MNKFLDCWFVVEEYVKPGMKVLEVGVGNGEMTKKIAKACNFNLYGIDYKKEMLRSVDTYLVDWKVIDLDKNRPFSFYGKEESFDVIVFSEVIEHLRYPEFALAYLIRMLKKGGVLICSTPNAAHYSRRLQSIIGYTPEDWTTTNHYHNWSVSQFRKVIEASGLDVESHVCINWVFPWLHTDPFKWASKAGMWSNLLCGDQIITARRVK